MKTYVSEPSSVCTIDRIMAYENGELEDDEVIEMFQAMINNGMVWQLQGHYGRTAHQLIQAGYCSTKQ